MGGPAKQPLTNTIVRKNSIARTPHNEDSSRRKIRYNKKGVADAKKDKKLKCPQSNEEGRGLW